MTTHPAVIEAEQVHLFYGTFHALQNISLSIRERKITALIGPSGCGKSTLVRVFNRMNDLIEGVRITGRITVLDRDILSRKTDLISLRKTVGMVFQRPNPFPLSIRGNLTFGLQIHPELSKNDYSEVVEESLRGVLLWDDLKDRLDYSALRLSLEQQQRLCIARVLAMKPQVILMDEPCSALDPIATLRIEELMQELRKNYTIVIVTHNMQQAARASDYTAFLYLGEMIEFGETKTMFSAPKEKRTEDYLTGRFG